MAKRTPRKKVSVETAKAVSLATAEDQDRLEVEARLTEYLLDQPVSISFKLPPLRCHLCGRGAEDVDGDLVCCEFAPEAQAAPDLFGRYSDAQRIERLEALLRADGRVVEFWFDDDPGVLWAGDQPGDSLRQALDDLIDADRATI